MAQRLIIVSNRLPVTARVREGHVQLTPSSGGLATGLRDCCERLDGLWIGWPGDVSGLSPEQRAGLDAMLMDQRIAPVHLAPEDVKQSYEGFSNAVIWPLFHYMLDRIPLDSRNWEAYRRSNERFAHAVIQHYQPGDLVWAHDYQLMLVPGLLRKRLPEARIGFFLHIPFPAFEVFRTLPWRAEILGGLLGADVIGFHTYAYVRYFTRALLHLLGIEPQVDRVHVDGREVQVRAFPMGIDTGRFERLAGESDVIEELEVIRRGAAGRQIVLGVDRLDYTKGIPRRLLAFDRLLEREPGLREKVRLIQVAVPSRVGVEPYRIFRRQLDELVGRINGAWGTPSDAPVHYMYRSIPAHQLVALYRAADVMLVTALRDGMNLVAKEFVASRIDEDGVLVLSEFAGAAAELGEALLINPYDIEGMAATIARALRMPRESRSARMRALRQRTSEWTVHRWTAAFLDQLQQPRRRFPVPEAPPVADAATLTARMRKANGLVLLLDYDGTLVPLERSPELAQPDELLMTLVRKLAEKCHVHLVSGRSPDTLATWFGNLPAALWAEHGAWHRPRPDDEWQYLGPPATGWMQQIRPILEQFTACTPGALIEQKAVSIAWHYRVADPEFAEKQARELRLVLEEAVRNQPLEVLDGSKVIEVRYRGVNKATVVERIMRSEGPSALLVAFGDDRTDEEMFAALSREHISVHVGQGPSCALFRLSDTSTVRELLYTLAADPG